MNGLEAFKQLCYNWAEEFNMSCVLDSCSLNTGVYSGRYELLVALGQRNVYRTYDELIAATEQQRWLFGVLSYDLKNEFEDLQSLNRSLFTTDPVVFFEPQTLVAICKTGEIEVEGVELPDELWALEWNENVPEHTLSKGNMQSKTDYLSKIGEIHELIREGEVYELNYCLAFEHEYPSFDPVSFHYDLLKRSPVPMAAFFKDNTQYMCGASMERYIMREGDRLISQPIKGTIGKGSDHAEDLQLIDELYHSTKDRAENVMIVDLVRNDLAKICESGSVKVDELFGIYSYLQVHQMISTISGTLRPNQTFHDILKASFPMGSMTGTPKISAMKHIDQLEDFSRGWYSGAMGYIAPNGDLDLNVVIRTLFYEKVNGRLQYCAGGAITIDSEAEKEWDEIQLKTKAITDLLGN